MLQCWIFLRSNFWFLPAVMILVAAALASGLVLFDASYSFDFGARFPRVFGANAEGARSILSTVASSMVSLAGVTFSITIVALSLASAQYSSRILRNFVRDRATQTVLGVFVSIFVYCLIVLRSIRGGDESFVPSLSIVTGIGLGIVGIAFLIFFIHHVATSIQASTIISRIGAETLSVISGLYPDSHAGEEEIRYESEPGLRDLVWTDISSRRMGYVQTIDYEGLAGWAERHDTVVRTWRGIGEFVIEGRPIAAVARGEPGEIDADELNAFFSVAAFRTIEQDVAFGLRQLVDIALKALSPGVNDSTTAVTCLHYIGAILARLARAKIPGVVCRHAGHLRVIARPQSFDSLVEEALTQILENARENRAIYLAMLDAIEAAIHPGLSAGRRMVLARQGDRVLQRVRTQLPGDGDLEPLRRRTSQITRELFPLAPPAEEKEGAPLTRQVQNTAARPDAVKRQP